MQTIEIYDENASCDSCGHSLADILNIVFEKEWKSDNRSRKEKCHCKNCGTPFILNYELFDKNGHIYSQIFSGDVNNPNFSWPELLTEEQRKEIADHLISCKECQKRLTEEMLADAWLAEVLENMRKISNSPSSSV